MIIEKFVIIFVECVLLIFLSLRYIRRYEPVNLIILPLLSLSLGVYITFVYYNVYIPLYLQIIISILGIVVPSIAMFLQYNNIIVTRKILYYSIKFKYMAGEYRKVIKLIEKLVKIEGRKSEYIYLLGKCYKNISDDINARDSFELAIEINKNDFKSYYELGLVYDETNKKDVAVAMFETAIKIKPDYYEAQEALGISLTSQGKFREAANVYKKALKLYPEFFELYYNIAIIELELGNYDAAEEAFKKAGEIKPDLYTAFYNIGNLDYLKGEYDSAIEAYRKTLNSGKYGPEGYYKIAIVYAAKKEYEKAMGSLEYAIELNPKYIDESKSEFIFKGMSNQINEYIENKIKSEEVAREKHNYMFDKFNIFKKKQNTNMEQELVQTAVNK